MLADPEIRQGIKDYANWPTIPQLYVNGEFVGGSDIMREMYESGELQQLLDKPSAAGAAPPGAVGTPRDAGPSSARHRSPTVPWRFAGNDRRRPSRLGAMAGSRGEGCDMEAIEGGSDTLFILLGAVMVLAMHAGFAFLELGTVRRKNQVNALVKILRRLRRLDDRLLLHRLRDRLRRELLRRRRVLAEKNGYELVKFFFLLTFAAAIPAIVSGGIAERARFNPQLAATFLLVGFVYPFFEGIAWNQHFGIQALAQGRVRRGVPRLRRHRRRPCDGRLDRRSSRCCCSARAAAATRRKAGSSAHPPSSIPFLALGAWILTVGWFGFNVMSAQTIDKISGLVAVNSLLAMAGGTLAAFVAGTNDPGFVHNGPLAGLVAVCAGSDVMHPLGALATGVVAGALFVVAVHADAEPLEDRRRARRLAAARPVRRLGRHRRRHLRRQGAGRPRRRGVRLAGGRDAARRRRSRSPAASIVYGVLKATVGLRLDPEEEYNGADLTIHKIRATPERETSW